MQQRIHPLPPRKPQMYLGVTFSNLTLFFYQALQFQLQMQQGISRNVGVFPSEIAQKGLDIFFYVFDLLCVHYTNSCHTDDFVKRKIYQYYHTHLVGCCILYKNLSVKLSSSSFFPRQVKCLKLPTYHNNSLNPNFRGNK